MLQETFAKIGIRILIRETLLNLSSHLDQNKTKLSQGKDVTWEFGSTGCRIVLSQRGTNKFKIFVFANYVGYEDFSYTIEVDNGRPLHLDMNFDAQHQYGIATNDIHQALYKQSLFALAHLMDKDLVRNLSIRAFGSEFLIDFKDHPTYPVNYSFAPSQLAEINPGLLKARKMVFELIMKRVPAFVGEWVDQALTQYERSGDDRYSVDIVRFNFGPNDYFRATVGVASTGFYLEFKTHEHVTPHTVELPVEWRERQTLVKTIFKQISDGFTATTEDYFAALYNLDLSYKNTSPDFGKLSLVRPGTKLTVNNKVLPFSNDFTIQLDGYFPKE